MPPVFAHGRLRLYLLKLLDESPRHGYEVIRLLEERFQGLYAPSAGTVYPRLAKLEKEGLVTHTTEGGRKVYSLTAAGRAELLSRRNELVDLEREIHDSVAELAAEIREDVRGAAGDLRQEMREAARRSRGSSGDEPRADGRGWRHDWQDQARRAKEESRQAKEEARSARRQAKEAQDFAREEVQRIVRRVQEEVQDHARRGDWQSAMREGLAELSREVSGFARTTPWPVFVRPDSAEHPAPEDTENPEDTGATEAERPTGPESGRTGPAEPADAGPTARESAGGEPAAGRGTGGEELPEWAEDDASTGDPARDLERLLDRFRDEVRDAARDHGVDGGQLREIRRRLGGTAARVTAALRGED